MDGIFQKNGKPDGNRVLKGGVESPRKMEKRSMIEELLHG